MSRDAASLVNFSATDFTLAALVALAEIKLPCPESLKEERFYCGYRGGAGSLVTEIETAGHSASSSVRQS